MLITQPGGGNRLGDFLIEQLADPRWVTFAAAVAFVKRSGVRHLSAAIQSFTERGRVNIIAGVDFGGTSKEGLSDLLECIGDNGDIWIFHNESEVTFHPKLYLFRNADQALFLVGSGNLTQGGLFTNYEASLVRHLDLHNDTDHQFMVNVDNMFAAWSNLGSGTCRCLDPDFLEELYSNGYVFNEARALSDGSDQQPERHSPSYSPRAGLFERVSVPRPPRIRIQSRPSQLTPGGRASTQPSFITESSYVMTLQRTDAGVGQTSPGASKRSPEIFIPLSARNANPGFWGWPDKFNEDPSREGKFDRSAVPMELNDVIISVNMMTWPVKHDFRLRNQSLRSAGNIGDIIMFEKLSDHPEAQYRVTIIKQDAPNFGEYTEKCNSPVRNSQKRFGYF